MTQSILNTILKILELEESQDYQDRSVIGGMNNFLQQTSFPSSETNNTTVDQELISLLKFDYTGTTIAKRRLWVTAVSNNIRGSLKLNTLDISPPRKKPVRRSPKSPAADAKPQMFNAVTTLKGVDTKTEQRLAKLGISNIWDLLFNPPRALVDYSNRININEITPGQTCTIQGEIWSSNTLRLGAKGRLPVGEIILGDHTGNIKCLWFGNRFIARTLKPGMRLSISGRPELYRGSLVFQTPEYEISNRSNTGIHTGRILPVYRLTSGLTAKKLRTLSWNTLKQYTEQIPDSHVPPGFYKSNNLMPLTESVTQLHFPDSIESHQAAKTTLGLEELIHLQLALSIKKSLEAAPSKARIVQPHEDFLQMFMNKLPFNLTGSQLHCIRSILADMSCPPKPMSRLLQGDVGSGKTVVVAAAILANIDSGFQSALMAPTEILAEQHYLTFQTLISPELNGNQSLKSLQILDCSILDRQVTIALLTGSTSPSQRKKIYAEVAEGSVDLLIGTQSLTNDDLNFDRLNLAVTDEQHRFGVLQRSELKDPSAIPPHSLTMSATPIPRTLSLSIYGDLDISTIDELPEGRRPVKTRSIPSEKTPVAYGFMEKQLISGRQAFVVCPAIDENPDTGVMSVNEVFKNIQTEYPDYTIELLHGRMSTKAKESIMERFRSGDVDVLVSTSVIEVGVDVPNANIMLIHGADRFGLSQLHQFRGRVGRGEAQSYCILISADPSETALERLSALENTTDGFVLAEQDLKLRGPGDYFGVRQSGVPSLKIANIFDHSLMQLARDTAAHILKADPLLRTNKNFHLKHNVDLLLAHIIEEAS